MSDIRLELQLSDETTAYRPGDVVRGTLRWSAEESPRLLAAQLVWWTEGKGNRDAAVGTRQEWEYPQAEGEYSFELTAPAGPLTYHGRLISILWAVEVVAEKPEGSARTEVTMSPTGEPITLDAADDPEEESTGDNRLFGFMR